MLFTEILEKMPLAALAAREKMLQFLLAAKAAKCSYFSLSPSRKVSAKAMDSSAFSSVSSLQCSLRNPFALTIRRAHSAERWPKKSRRAAAPKAVAAREPRASCYVSHKIFPFIIILTMHGIKALLVAWLSYMLLQATQ